MAIDSGFNYDRLLTLDQAKLVGRTRINNLGSYELTINYNKITSSTKEDCLEWLEANRLTAINPIVSNKTYEGTWKCVSIAYDENKSIIQQIFKIDSSVGDLGDWDGTPPEPTGPEWDAQSGDVSRISDGMEIQKAYYWKITNPESVNLPSASITGEIWTKTANDNGDGTYDVVVAREVEVNLEGTNTADNFASNEVTVVSTNEAALVAPTATLGVVESVTNNPQENGLFRTSETTITAKNQDATNNTESYAYSEVTETNTNTTEKTVPAANIGDVVSVSNTPLENGYFKTAETTRTGKNQTGDSEVQLYGEDDDADVINETDILISGGTKTGVNQYYRHVSGTIGDTDAVWEGRTDTTWEVKNVSGTLWQIVSGTYGQEAFRPYPNLNSSNWFEGTISSSPAVDFYLHTLIVQIGFNPKASETTSETNTNSTQVVFGTGVGEEPYPTVGQEKVINNVPLDNGKYKTTVTTTTVNEQRVPALTDAIAFANNSDGAVQVQNYNGERGSLIVGKNATYENFQASVNNMNKYRYVNQNSVSFNINKYGLYDYTIRSANI